MSSDASSKRRRDPSAKREAIRAHALSLFARHGYEAVSVAQIAASAGVAVGSVYRQYPDKLAILRELHTQMEARFVGCVDDAWDEVLPPPARFDALAIALFALMEEQREALAILTMTTDIRYADGTAPGDALRAVIARKLEPLRKNGALCAGALPDLASTAHGLVAGGMAAWMQEPTDARREDLASLVGDMLARALLVQSSTSNA